MSDLLQEIKDYLDSIRHNAANMALARSSDEYNVCTKIVFDCEDAILSLFRKRDHEYWELLGQFERAQAKAERLENAIKETLETLKRGGPGTRSQVKQLLEKALEGEE